ncbi:MAG: hypothetical protein JZU50_01125 [Desulfobulbaceae bacterium]|jgi:hypothetical protein|nr:hypothetical protein [Desulfobulbaceae bacterium]
MPPTTSTFEKATFRNTTAGGTAFEVHFNPQTLQYIITNTLANTGSGNATKQYTGESTGKLTFDLIYDTTDTGEDVRLHTVRVAELMKPGDNEDKTPPVVEFGWGLYTFTGMVESYRETIDFFSANGVPLRASVNLTLSRQDRVFEGGSRGANAGTGGSMAGRGNPNAVQAPPPGANDGRGVTQTAAQAGNPEAARTIAAQNGIENMRFPGSAPLQLNASSSALGAASLAGGSSNTEVNIGGVFAGLHTRSEAKVSGGIKLGNFLRASATASLGTEDPAAFALGGQARLQGSASFKADVGKAGALKARIEFDGGE